MPIYEYQCSACGHQLDAFQKMDEAALTDCPECGKPSLQKLVSAAGFQLKGTGWYATDFKSKPKTEPSKQDDKAKGKDDKSSSSGTTGSST